MNMRELVAEELIVYFLGLINFGQDFGHVVDVFDQLKTLGGGKLEQLSGMALEHNDGPAGKKLVIMEIDLGQSEVYEKMVLSRPSSLAS
jgi:hypothetical protein